MQAKWTIRLATLALGLGLMASAAFAAKDNTSSSAGEYVGWCDSMCHGLTTDTLEAPYPAAQPLETCNDEVCIFW